MSKGPDGLVILSSNSLPARLPLDYPTRLRIRRSANRHERHVPNVGIPLSESEGTVGYRAHLTRRPTGEEYIPEPSAAVSVSRDENPAARAEGHICHQIGSSCQGRADLLVSDNAPELDGAVLACRGEELTVRAESY